MTLVPVIGRRHGDEFVALLIQDDAGVIDWLPTRDDLGREEHIACEAIDRDYWDLQQDRED